MRWLTDQLGKNKLASASVSKVLGGGVGGLPSRESITDSMGLGALSKTGLLPDKKGAMKEYKDLYNKLDTGKEAVGIANKFMPTSPDLQGAWAQNGAGSMQNMRDFAQNGPSAWMTMANQKQGLEQANLLNQASQGQASALSQAQNNLMMRGGMNSGARERLQGMGAQNLMQARQGVLNQGALGRADIGLQGETMRQDVMKQLPGMELQALQPMQQAHQNAFANYQEKMKAYSGAEQGRAAAIGARPGKKG